MHLSVTTTSSGIIRQSIRLNLPIKGIYADIIKQFELEFVGENASCFRITNYGTMNVLKNNVSMITLLNCAHWLMLANLRNERI